MEESELIRLTDLHDGDEVIKELLKLCIAIPALYSPWVMVLDRHSSATAAQPQSPMIHIVSNNTDTTWQRMLSYQILKDGLYCIKELAVFFANYPILKQENFQKSFSVPATLSDGTLYGAVCSVSHGEQQDSQQIMAFLMSLAKIISRVAEDQLTVNQLKEDNYQLALHSYTDALTQLPNRRAIFEKLPGLFSLASRLSRTVILAYIDLDDFKKVNDELGHETGDELLKEVGIRLKRAIRKEDIIGRLGGDEFLLAGLGPETGTDTGRTLSVLRERIHKSIRGQYKFIHLCLQYRGASVGVVSIEPEHCSVDDAIKLADNAMYQDKATHRQVAGKKSVTKKSTN